MADYPTSVKTFTTKSAGEVIQAAHINDLQDEVNALEDGLINGIKHDILPSTNSTRSLGSDAKRWKEGHFSSLYVAGGAVAGGSLDAARVSDTGELEVAANTKTLVTFTTQDKVTNSSMHSTGTNPARLTAQSSGMYHLSAGIDLRQSGAGVFGQVELLLNDTTVIARTYEVPDVNGSSTRTLHSVHTIYPLETDDFVEVRVEIGSSGIVRGSTTSSIVKYFSMAKT